MGEPDRKTFRELVESTLQLSEEFSGMIDDAPNAGPMWSDRKRRKRVTNAIMTCWPLITKKIQSVGQMNVNVCFAHAAAFYHDTPEGLQESTNVETAAALWMRDRLEESQEGSDCLRDLMQDDSLLPLEIDQVPMRDPVRPDDSIDALTKVVTYRLSRDHYLYDNYSPSRNGPTDVLYRRALDTIDPDMIKDAEDIFLDRYMAYMETAMKIAKIYILEMDRTFEEIAGKMPKPRTALSMPPQEDALENLTKEEPEPETDPVVDMYFALCNLPYLVVGMHFLMSNNRNGDKIMKIAGEFDPLHTSNGRDVDPFTMAFGYCRMMDRNDDLIFLLGVSVPLMRVYAYMDPWGVYDFEEFKDLSLPGWCEKSKNIYARRVWRKQSGHTRADSIGCYFSLAQLVYRQVGFVLTDSWNEDVSFQIGKKTLTDNDIALIADSLSMMCIEENAADKTYNRTDVFQEEDEMEPDEPDEPEPEPVDEEVSDRELQLQNKLKEVQDLLKTSERGRAAAEKEVRTIREETASQRRELFDLRELLYKSLSEHEPEEENVAEKDRELLPCSVKKKTVIFGGHESWRKVIKDLLTGVTIAPNKKMVNTDLIRHADVVWIQVNAISHAAYYTICDYARSHNIPIRYFTFNSAESCAIQLAKADAHEI